MEAVPAWLVVVTALLALTAFVLCVLVWVGWPEIWDLIAARLARWWAEGADFWLEAAAAIAALVIPLALIVFLLRRALLR